MLKGGINTINALYTLWPTVIMCMFSITVRITVRELQIAGRLCPATENYQRPSVMILCQESIALNRPINKFFGLYVAPWYGELMATS